jgi:hypothetical protein
MYALRYNDAVGPKVKAAPNTLWRIEDVATPTIAEQEGFVLPNWRDVEILEFSSTTPFAAENMLLRSTTSFRRERRGRTTQCDTASSCNSC